MQSVSVNDKEHRLKIGELVLIPGAHRYQARQTEKKIAAKPLQVLLLLAEHANQVVSREQLIEQVWDSNYYVGDKALSNIIWKLRKILAEANGSEVEAIETIPKQGYRLRLEVKTLLASETSATISEVREGRDRFKSYLWLLPFLIVGLAMFMFLSHRTASVTVSSKLQPEQLTKKTGEERYPSLSPDGKHLAYVWRSSSEHYQLRVRDSNTPNSDRIVFESDAALYSPDWVPNSGSLVLAVQPVEGQCRLLQVFVSDKPAEPLGRCANNFTGSHAISPDGRWLAFARKHNQNGGPGGIFIRNRENGEGRQLTFVAPSKYMPFDLSWAPNSRQLAFTRMHSISDNGIAVVNLEGKVQTVVEPEAKIRGHTWRHDGENLIFASDRGKGWQLYSVKISNDQPRPLDIVGAHYPSLSRHNHSLLYEKRQQYFTIEEVFLPSEGHATRTPIRIESLGNDYDVSYSQVNGKLVFTSNRDGTDSIWIANTDGTGQMKVTPDNQKANYPMWSPSGKQLAFISKGKDKTYDQAFVLDRKSGAVRQVTETLTPHLNPTWGRNEEYIYTSRPANGQWNIWQYPLDGSLGQRVTNNGGLYALEGPKGEWLYFTKYQRAGIWRKHLSSGTESLLVETRSQDIQGNWTLADNGIYFRDRDEQADLFRFYSFATKSITTVATLPPNTVYNGVLSYIPARHSLLYTKWDKNQSDVFALPFGPESDH